MLDSRNARVTSPVDRASIWCNHALSSNTANTCRALTKLTSWCTPTTALVNHTAGSKNWVCTLFSVHFSMHILCSRSQLALTWHSWPFWSIPSTISVLARQTSSDVSMPIQWNILWLLVSRLQFVVLVDLPDVPQCLLSIHLKHSRQLLQERDHSVVVLFVWHVVYARTAAITVHLVQISQHCVSAASGSTVTSKLTVWNFLQPAFV